MVDDDDLPQKLLRDRGWVFGRTENRPSPEVGLRYTPQIEADVVPGHGLLHRRVMGLDRLHFSGDAFWHYHNRVSDPNPPGLDPPDGHRPHPGNRVHILYGNPQRLVDRLGRLGEVVEGLKQDPPLVPGHVRPLLDQVLPRPPPDRDNLHFLDVVT